MNTLVLLECATIRTDLSAMARVVAFAGLMLLEGLVCQKVFAARPASEAIIEYVIEKTATIVNERAPRDNAA